MTDNIRLTPEQAAPILGMHPDCIRAAMRKGTLPIGHARKASTGKGYRYDIYKALVLKYVGNSETMA